MKKEFFESFATFQILVLLYIIDIIMYRDIEIIVGGLHEEITSYFSNNQSMKYIKYQCVLYYTDFRISCSLLPPVIHQLVVPYRTIITYCHAIVEPSVSTNQIQNKLIERDVSRAIKFESNFFTILGRYTNLHEMNWSKK